jgi:hypothetical protein
MTKTLHSNILFLPVNIDVYNGNTDNSIYDHIEVQNCVYQIHQL